MQPKTVYSYTAEIVRSGGGGFGRRPVPDAQFEPCRVQLKFNALRRGKLAANALGASVIEQPIFRDAATGEIKGVTMSVGDNGDRVEQQYSLDLLHSFAQKMATELVESKQLESADELRFRVFAQETTAASANDNIVATVRETALPLLPGQLEPLINISEAVGPSNDDDYPVFVLTSALERAEEIVWQRNQERGVWLVGNLFQQINPEHEVFAIVHTVIEARGATHERFSLDLTNETWDHASEQLARRRKRFGKTAEVILGFFHSHPFLPSILDGKEACPTCPLRPECKLTSSFFSQRDALFHAATFGRAGYAIEFVLGLDPREKFDLKLFALDGGKFRERGYYSLAELPAGYCD